MQMKPMTEAVIISAPVCFFAEYFSKLKYRIFISGLSRSGGLL